MWDWILAGWRQIAQVLFGSSQQERDAEAMRVLDGVSALATVVQQRIFEAPDGDSCPCCAGHRCLAWRKSGHFRGCGDHTVGNMLCYHLDENGDRVPGCGGVGEPVPHGITTWQLVETTFLNPGRHTIRYLAQHAVPWGWNPLSLRVRVSLWPSRYAEKLGRQPQLRSYRTAGALP